MKTRKCPDCVQYIHFDDKVGIERCWNCGLITDFSKRLSAEQKLGLLVDRRISWLLTPFLDTMRWKRWSGVALVGVLPFAVVMLLICNSLAIHIVQDAAAPFFCF